MKAKHQNVNDEYLCAVRTKSFVDFFLHFQSLLPNEPSTSDPTHSHPSFSEPLLNPDQETVASLLESSILANEPPRQRALLSDYFHVSAEASVLCGHLIARLVQLQSDYRSIDRTIGSIQPEGDTWRAIASELRARVALASGPFSDLSCSQEFRRAQERHSSILLQLRSSKKRMRRRMRVLRLLDRAASACITAACGAAAAAAAFLAVHALAAVLAGPALLAMNGPLKNKKKKKKSTTRRRFWFLNYGAMRRGVERMDVAAKGAYILKRDFDTIGRLVARIEAEVEHNRATVEMCVERGEGRGWVQVVKEIERYEYGVGKQADELQEHVYLCLVTINRARAMLVREICRND